MGPPISLSAGWLTCQICKSRILKIFCTCKLLFAIRSPFFPLSRLSVCLSTTSPPTSSQVSVSARRSAASSQAFEFILSAAITKCLFLSSSPPLKPAAPSADSPATFSFSFPSLANPVNFFCYYYSLSLLLFLLFEEFSTQYQVKSLKQKEIRIPFTWDINPVSFNLTAEYQQAFSVGKDSKMSRVEWSFPFLQPEPNICLLDCLGNS